MFRPYFQSPRTPDGDDWLATRLPLDREQAGRLGRPEATSNCPAIYPELLSDVLEPQVAAARGTESILVGSVDHRDVEADAG
jgi:hypothetical protein